VSRCGPWRIHPARINNNSRLNAAIASAAGYEKYTRSTLCLNTKAILDFRFWIIVELFETKINQDKPLPLGILILSL
jgi:hypothetical protein